MVPPTPHCTRQPRHGARHNLSFTLSPSNLVTLLPPPTRCHHKLAPPNLPPPTSQPVVLANGITLLNPFLAPPAEQHQRTTHEPAAAQSATADADA